MGRISAPIKKFKTKTEQLTSDKFKKVAIKYVHLAKELDKNYENEIFEGWKTDNTKNAIDLLKRNILVKIEEKKSKS